MIFTKQVDSVYMNTAIQFASLSKARRKKVGAVLVTKNNVILTGYNGTPSGTDNNCEEEKLKELVTKPEVIHAELNCVMKAAREGISVVDSVIYVTLSPCMRCAAMLKQAGVRMVMYKDEYDGENGVDYLNNNGVQCFQQ